MPANPSGVQPSAQSQQSRRKPHICKWLELLAVLSGNKRAYRLESVTAFNMDDTAQIEKRRVGIVTSCTFCWIGLGTFYKFWPGEDFLQVAGRVTGFFNWHWDSLHTVCLGTSGFGLTQNWWRHFTGDWRW